MAVAIALAGAGFIVAGGGAQAQRDGVADALAGHGAEMRQALGGGDPMRRAFFYDAVDIEGPNPGVPCDHIAARRPDAVTGTGTVVLIESAEARPRLLRFWAPPDFGQVENAAAAASDYARQQGMAEFRVLGLRRFAWCR